MTEFLLLFLIVCLIFPTSSTSCLKHPGDRKQRCLTDLPKCVEGCDLCLDGMCLNCVDGQFLDFNSLQCEKCYQGCKSCYGPSLIECYRLQRGFRFNKDTKTIESCPEGCIECTATDGSCTGCMLGETPYISPETDKLSCHKCLVEGCQTCQYQSNQCQVCLDGWRMEGSKCLKVEPPPPPCKNRSFNGQVCYDCPPKQRYSHELRRCVYCPNECRECSKTGTCTYCQAGYKLEGSTCVQCKVKGCLECPEKLNVCLQCIEGMYFDFTMMKCLPCHSECATCSGPNRGDCKSCRFSDVIVQRDYHEHIEETYIHKMRTELLEKFPELQKLHMSFQKMFHPTFDLFCNATCPDGSYLDHYHSFQILGVDSPSQNPSHPSYTQSCLALHGPHPTQHLMNLDELHQEFDHAHDEKQHEERVKMIENRKARKEKQRAYWKKQREQQEALIEQQRKLNRQKEDRDKLGGDL